MPRSLTLASLACGLLLSTPAFAASFHISTSASTRVTTDENGTVTRTEESHVTEKHSNEGATQSRLSTDATKTVRSGSTRTVQTEKGKVTGASAGVRITSSMKRSGKAGSVQMRLARRICTRLSSEDKEQCIDDAAEGTISAVREKLRMWLERR